jgi:hypothetical protein
MANISGTFSNPSAGRLHVTFTGVFVVGSIGRDAGFPSGASNLLMRANINGNYTTTIDRANAIGILDIDYPGGNAAWAVTTEDVTHSSGGSLSSFGFKNLQLVLVLTKK